jgi:hypothetical protein
LWVPCRRFAFIPCPPCVYRSCQYPSPLPSAFNAAVHPPTVSTSGANVLAPSATADVDAVSGAVALGVLSAALAVGTATVYKRDGMAWEAEFDRAARHYSEAVRLSG